MIHKEAFLKYLRACAVCHHFLPPCDWLCSFCWKCIEREYLYSEDTYRAEKTLPHLRLLDWHEDNHVLIQSFVKSLKNANTEFIFRRLGLEMFSRFINLNLWNQKECPVFIPVPSRQNNKEDHAYSLAQSLSFYFAGEKIQALERPAKTYQSQKRKNKLDRAKIKILKKKELSISNRVIVLVDDVVTTGATARACWRALGEPKKFFIFSLAWKRPKHPQLQ